MAKKEETHQDVIIEEEVQDVEQELVEDPKSESSESNPQSEEKIALLQTEKDELYQKLLRVQAEYDNYRKRTQRERAADLQYKSQTLVTELLPVVDNFERALEVESTDGEAKPFIEGIEMVYRQLITALEKENIEVIATIGETFDPNIHQAVMQVEDDQYESNIVVEEMQRGYKLKDRVIRPAMVKVNQ